MTGKPRSFHLRPALYARKHFGPLKATLAITAQVIGLVARGLLYPLGAQLGRAELKPFARHQWAGIAAVLACWRPAIFPSRKLAG